MKDLWLVTANGVAKRVFSSCGEWPLLRSKQPTCSLCNCEEGGLGGLLGSGSHIWLIIHVTQAINDICRFTLASMLHNITNLAACALFLYP